MSFIRIKINKNNAYLTAKIVGRVGVDSDAKKKLLEKLF